MIYNDRVRKARRVIERVFGIMKKKFRILDMQCEELPGKKMKLSWCCVILHNMMTRHRLLLDLPEEDLDDESQSAQPVRQIRDDEDADTLSPAVVASMLEAGKHRRDQLVVELAHDF